MSKHQKDLPPIPLESPKGGTYMYTSPRQHKQRPLQTQNRRLQEQKEKLHQTIYIQKQNDNFIYITQTVCSAFKSYRERAIAMPAEDLSPSPIDQVIGAYAAFSNSKGDFF
ncbi:hypothetical protein GGI35DRAFT_472879 [Trichoderma velutinum]